MQADSITDLTALCRVCMMAKEENRTDLYDSSSFAAGKLSLHGMLKTICPPVFAKSEANDPPGMPTVVCLTCRNATVAAFELYEMCVETDRRLVELLALRWELQGPGGSDSLEGCTNVDTVEGDGELHQNSSPLAGSLVQPLDGKGLQDPLSSQEHLGIIKDEPLDLMDENEEDCYDSNLEEDKEEEAGETSSQKLHHCEICNKSFKKACSKITHISYRHPEIVDPNGPYTCDFCGKTFGFSGPMRLHRNLHLGALVCSCGQSFTGKKTFNAHVETGTCSGAQDRECKVCNKTFRSPYDVANHRRMVHAEQFKTLPDFRCDICERDFQTLRSFKDHKRTHHATATQQKLPKCSICNETFATESARSNHRRKHFGPFKCTMCDKVFKNKYGLKGHMIRHTGEKPFACDLCPMRFFASVEIKEHMLTHTKAKDHTCEICGSRFSKIASMKKHIRFVHEGQRPYECSVCGYKCSITSQLKRHMLIHTGEKPHKCQLCPQAYAQTNDLVKHVARVHGIDKPYQCDRCDEGFRLLTELRQHCQVHAQSGEGSGLKEEVRFTSVAILQRAFGKDKLQQQAEENDESS